MTPTGAAYWKRVALPSDGGIGEQDARLILGMDYAAELHQQLLEDNRKAAERAAKLKAQSNG